MSTYRDNYETPIGKMEIIANDSAVLSIHFVDQPAEICSNHITDLAKQQMLEYFSGQRREFDMPMTSQGTDFQKRVWNALTTVAYGKTCSYRDIAEKIMNPKAVRAVGTANGRNPMTIVVPCHRIIGSDGSLTGYASGTERKAWLLRHEAPDLLS